MLGQPARSVCFHQLPTSMLVVGYRALHVSKPLDYDAFKVAPDSIYTSGREREEKKLKRLQVSFRPQIVPSLQFCDFTWPYLSLILLLVSSRLVSSHLIFSIQSSGLEAIAPCCRVN